MINVLIKDGNRTVNWDYSEDKTIAEILKDNDFRPVPGSIMVGGYLSVEDPTAGKLADCPMRLVPKSKHMMRVVITLKSQPEKRPVAKKEMGDADVR